MNNLLPQSIQHFLTKNAKGIKWLIALALLLLTLALAWKSTRVVYAFLPEWRNDIQLLQQSKQKALAANNQQKNGVSLDPSLALLHLFGDVKKEEEAPPPPPRKQALPKMSVVVQGIIAMKNKKLSSAVLTTHGSTNKVYGIGDHLSNDIELVNIFSDYVVISRKGIEESIYLQKDTTVKANISKKTSAQPRVANKTGLNSLLPNKHENMNEMSFNSISELMKGSRVQRQDVQDFYQYLSQVPETDLLATIEEAVAQDPSQAVRRLGLRAQKNKGYLVTSRVPKHIVDAYNLRYGDRILSINGQDLGNPSQDKEIFNQVRSEGQASVKLQRGRQITTITVRLINSYLNS